MIRFLKELFTPSGFTGPASDEYRRSAEGVYHAVLGATIAWAFWWIGHPVSPLYVVLIYALKELFDNRAGGSLRDSAEDIIAVGIGALAFSTVHWPIVLLAVGLIIGLIASSKL
ncbi:hypothetical protein [Paracoccus sp. (in: a-proteobacteria)]|uniref:hypothetical protein n=1 Tax=Paracoccus sp. TaxID=267 RepID=UPI004058F008